MGIVEEDLHNHEEHEEVEYGGGKGGQLVATLVAPQVYQGVGGEVEEWTHNQSVESDKLQRPLVLLPVHLLAWKEAIT